MPYVYVKKYVPYVRKKPNRKPKWIPRKEFLAQLHKKRKYRGFKKY